MHSVATDFIGAGKTLIIVTESLLAWRWKVQAAISSLLVMWSPSTFGKFQREAVALLVKEIIGRVVMRDS